MGLLNYAPALLGERQWSGGGTPAVERSTWTGRVLGPRELPAALQGHG
jgi:hypothetical protein